MKKIEKNISQFFLTSSILLYNLPPTSQQMKLPAKLAIASLAIVTTASIANAQNATTDPVGFVTFTIPAGDGTTKKTVLISAPLYDVASINGSATGSISAVSSTSIQNSSAGWTAGQLSQASGPYLVQVTSGNASGAMFLIDNNTSTALTINSTYSSVDPATLGVVAGDTYRISPCDTISSLFGGPGQGVIGSTAQATADTLQIVIGGTSFTYFYKTNATPAGWVRVALGNPASDNVPILPNMGIQFSRIGSSPLTYTITGSVPVTRRLSEVKNSGLTILASFWPTDTTLNSIGLQNIPGWTTGANQTVADIVVTRNMTTGGSQTFFHNGTNWKRVGLGAPPSSNDEPIPVGTSIRIFRKGSGAGNASLAQNPPYSL
jgi:uncharacterized protein (TIGR02597 family)